MSWARLILLTIIASLASAACGFIQAPTRPSTPPVVPPAPPAQAARAPLILLYDNIPSQETLIRVKALPAERWLQVDQDPASYKTGIIDVDYVLKQVESRTNGRPPEWAMLDFEEPFYADLQQPRDSDVYKRAVKAMTGALRAVKATYPNTKWSFYGIPNLSYWINGQGWAHAPREQQAETLKRSADACAPIVADVDWVSVSIYDYYDPKMIVPGSPKSIRGTPESVREDGRAWRKAQVGLAKLLAQGKPVIPTVFPYWAPGGVAPACRLLQPRRFLEEQIVPAVEAGATGFAMWANLSFRINQVVDGGKDPAYISKEKNFGIAEWRSAFTADYFNGMPPQNWNDPMVRSTLVRKTSQTMLDAMTNIRNWEKTGVIDLPSVN